jgi:hypothetical protein
MQDTLQKRIFAHLLGKRIEPGDRVLQSPSAGRRLHSPRWTAASPHHTTTQAGDPAQVSEHCARHPTTRVTTDKTPPCVIEAYHDPDRVGPSRGYILDDLFGYHSLNEVIAPRARNARSNRRGTRFHHIPEAVSPESPHLIFNVALMRNLDRNRRTIDNNLYHASLAPYCRQLPHTIRSMRTGLGSGRR